MGTINNSVLYKKKQLTNHFVTHFFWSGHLHPEPYLCKQNSKVVRWSSYLYDIILYNLTYIRQAIHILITICNIKTLVCILVILYI